MRYLIYADPPLRWKETDDKGNTIEKAQGSGIRHYEIDGEEVDEEAFYTKWPYES